MNGFLEAITYREAWLSLEALDEGELGAYAGSAVRGALGHLLRPALCRGEGCGHECRRPDGCHYYALFEQARSAAGGNAPKPLVLDVVNPDLELIALGGPVNLPFRTGPPDSARSLPRLRNERGSRMSSGAAMRIGIRLLGPLSSALGGVVEAVARQGLSVGGVSFRLNAAIDGRGLPIYDRRFPTIPMQTPALMRLANEVERARRVRIVFQTPTVLKLAGSPSFDPEDFAARFFEHGLARAAQVHNCLMEQPRLPWMEAPAVRARTAGHRLFRYELPRHSYRQEKWMNFDGVVGWLDLEGDLDGGMPYARAAEILHFGQKATFGLGKVRVFVLD